MTIRTVTLSPGFDHHVNIDELKAGGVSHILSWRVVASGKGVNVARTASLLGASCVAYSLVGQDDRDEFVALIEGAGVRAVTVEVPGRTRKNLTLSSKCSSHAAAHSVGDRLRANQSQAEALLAQLVDEVSSGDLVTFNGAVATGVGPDVWADAAKAVHSRGGTVLADVQDQAFINLLATGCANMAKPNEEESQALPGVFGDGSRIEMATQALKAMREFGVALPVVTLGSEGVLHLRNGEVALTSCPVKDVAVVVGAGDSFLAGYCSALEVSTWIDVDPVALGVAAAAAHVAGYQDADLRVATRSALDRVTTRV